MKILLISNTLPPYRVPLFNAIQEESNHDWFAVFEGRGLPHTHWEDVSNALKMPHCFLSENHRLNGHRDSALSIAKALSRIMRERRPDLVVLGGWHSLAVWSAWMKSRLTRTPVVLWSGVTEASVGRRNPLVSGLRRCIIRTCDAHVAYSTAAANFLQVRGAQRESIFVGPNVGDVDYYFHHVWDYRSGNPVEPGRTRLLYVGQLIPRKGIRELFVVLAALQRDDWNLRIVGTGPLRGELASLACELGIEKQAIFIDHQDREGLVKQYAESDVFILPSLLEVGAIVSSEAIASGLYSLISTADGVAPDLIKPGVNGDYIDVTDTSGCATVITRTLDRARRGELNRGQIRQTARNFSAQHYARAFLNAADHAIRKRHRRSAN